MNRRTNGCNTRVHRRDPNTRNKLKEGEGFLTESATFLTLFYCGEVPLIPTDVAELGLTEKVTIFLLTLKMYIVYHKRVIRL